MVDEQLLNWAGLHGYPEDRTRIIELLEDAELDCIVRECASTHRREQNGLAFGGDEHDMLCDAGDRLQ